MRPYDDKEYRYTSADLDKEKAIAIISNILGFHPSTEELDYSLSFYSGGGGIVDRLAIRCRANQSNRSSLISGLGLRAPLEAMADPMWVDDFRWLIKSDESLGNTDLWCYKFINSNKHEFQDVVDSTCELVFSNGSDVNSWCAIWFTNNHLNYLYFDQG